MKRILVFNFFGGVMDRGIPLYAQDMVTCLRRVGMEAVELRCPASLRGAPQFVRNLLFVFFEQIVAPIMRMANCCSLTVYPYNSVGILDSLLGRSVLVIHDLIPNHRSDRRLAARYIRSTQAMHRALRRSVCAASPHTLAQLHRLPAFHRCNVRLWSNPFYAFEEAFKRAGVQRRARSGNVKRVLLCSGMGRNKDYAGAIKLFRRSKRLADAELRIIGFGDDANLARRRVMRVPYDVRTRIRILPRLDLAQVVEEYASADLVWVHSKKEGFGRCVVEALLAHRPVIASDIGAFRKLAHQGLFLYRPNGLDASVAAALSRTHECGMSFENYHAPLEDAVRAVILEHENRRAAGRGK